VPCDLGTIDDDVLVQLVDSVNVMIEGTSVCVILTVCKLGLNLIDKMQSTTTYICEYIHTYVYTV